MDAHDQYLSLLVATDAALLMILALLAKKLLVWKPPARQPISRRRQEPVERLWFGSVPRRTRVVLVIGVCLGGAVTGVAGATAPAALMVCVAGAVLILLATR
ncbi:MAG TPA: hypothetical protein VIA10_03865 [Gaiellaceae bacterium]